MKENIKKKYEFNESLDTYQVSQFKKILNKLKDKDIKTIVITMPTYHYHDIKKVEKYYDNLIKNFENDSAIIFLGLKIFLRIFLIII